MGYKMKDPTFFKTSIKGYRKDSPDKNEPQLKIPSNKISMEGVEHKVHGKDNLGNEKVMEPGKNYKFPGDYVIETPLTQHQTSDHLLSEGGGGGEDDKTPTQSELLLKRQRDKWKNKGDQIATGVVNTGSWSGAPTKQTWNIIDNRSEEEKKKEQEEIAEEERLKKEEQDRIDRQIKGEIDPNYKPKYPKK